MDNLIQSLWVGPELSVIERLCMASFVANGHEYHLYVYDDVPNVPNGVIVKDANRIIPRKDIFVYSRGARKDSVAGFSDWFRYELLHLAGGFWVDTDVVCLRKFDFDEELVFACMSTFPFAYIHENQGIGNAIMKFPEGYELTRILANLCANPNTIMPYDPASKKVKKIIRKFFMGNRRDHVPWGESGGPLGLTRALNYYNLIDRAKPFTYFYPIHYSWWMSVFDDTFKDNMGYFNGSYAIHLWTEMMRRASGFDKNASFSHDSVIEHLKRKYL